MGEPVKYCKDCRHFRSSGLSPHPPRCAHPDFLGQHLVFGPVTMEAMDARLSNKHCGWGARLFQPKLTLWQRVTGAKP